MRNVLIYMRIMPWRMASLLQIRNVPDETRRALKARAAGRGESLNSYLLDVIAREVARPTVAEVLDRAARRAERVGGSSLDAVLGGRSDRGAGDQAPAPP
jgi:antitoxin FitA